MAYDLECRDIVKTFGSFIAVSGVSLQVPQGSFFSILGPSGCGKTTLMRMIAGFSHPTSGDILINNRSILDTPPNKRPVNMVFQHLALFPMMSVAENIGYGLRRRGLPRADIDKRVGAALERVGLPQAGTKRIDQLSGGQKQRVAIARCMVLEPTVLLLDEPLGALDLKLREHMKIELKQLQAQFGTTFVYITHDQSEALVMSDQVAVMNGGKFEQVGTPQELYYKPASAFVAGFVGDSHHWRGKVVRANGGGVLATTASGLELYAASGPGARLHEGDAIDLFVRPEAIDILPRNTAAQAGDATVNLLSGTIENILFNGMNSRAMVALAGGDQIAVALPQTGVSASLRPGVEVDLRFDAARLTGFAATGATA